ncbi:MAG: hypothetical protein ACXVB9_10465 [Bdellovibrionota bacterium]
MIKTALVLFTATLSTAAFAKECSFGIAKGIVVESVSVGENKASIESSGVGDNFETYEYKFKKTGNGTFAGKNFSMTCEGQDCEISGKVPKSSEMQAGKSFEIKNVKCDSASAEADETDEAVSEDALCLHNVECGPNRRHKVDSHGCMSCVPKK